MVRLVCPACHNESFVEDNTQAALCDSCGSALSSIDEPVAVEAGNADEDTLVEKLREAFRVEADAQGELLVRSEVMRVGDHVITAGPAAAPATRGVLQSGSRFADFKIVDELGRGGMGVVYRAHQLSLNRDVALKVLPADSRHGQRATNRFRQEAQAAAKLNHTNVVPVYAQGEYDGHYYYAMKLIDGISLDTAIKTQPHLLSSTHASTAPASSTKEAAPPAIDQAKEPPLENERGVTPPRSEEDFRFIASLMVGVADGLAHAHSSGVVHRDIKPHNLILGTDRRLHIVDFGLARLESEPHLTITGEVMGTPVYLSPEQARGDVAAIGAATDIYSAGVTLYELLTDQRAFGGDTRDQILQAVCHDEPTRPRVIDSRIPRDIETICLRAMAKDMSARYPSAEAFAEDLRRFADGRPILSRRISAVERAAKWVRRHKAVSLATAAVAALSIVSVAWSVSAAAARQREGEQLIDQVYDELVHRNYQRSDAMAPLLERANALRGTADTKTLFVEALCDLGRKDRIEGSAKLQQLLAEEPDSVEALYVLSWAQWRLDTKDSRATFDLAEELRVPESAEEWFFRGLAVHYRDPVEARECYQKAIAIRAATDRYFHQAGLHLARANNQIMYRNRSLDSFEDAVHTLRTLINHEHYRAYPHYLLAIAYRLKAEVLEEQGEAERALDFFEESLKAARRGQTVDPTDAGPISAEATALERLGLYREAIAVRDLAAKVTELEDYRCESYHYRWRLHFWLGNLTEAAEDVARHAECKPDDPFYGCFYPALLTAASGDVDAGHAILAEWLDTAPMTPTTVLTVACGHRLLGSEADAAALLENHEADLDFTGEQTPSRPAEWTATLYAFARGQTTLEDVKALASEAQYARPLLAEAYFHAAARDLALGDRESARELLAKSHKTFAGELSFSYHARTLHERMVGDTGWPEWVPLRQLGRDRPGVTTDEGVEARPG